MKPASSSSFFRISVSVAVAALGVLLVVRAGELSAKPPRLTAHGEKLWLGWSWRDPAMTATLRRIEPNLRPGEIVYLIGPQKDEPSWLRVMAQYSWPRQTLAGVGHDWPGGRRPPHLTIVRISGNGVFQIDRISPDRMTPSSPDAHP